VPKHDNIIIMHKALKLELTGIDLGFHVDRCLEKCRQICCIHIHQIELGLHLTNYIVTLHVAFNKINNIGCLYLQMKDSH